MVIIYEIFFSCPVDPMPTRFIKDHLNLVVCDTTAISNDSLLTGSSVVHVFQPLPCTTSLEETRL